MKTPPSIYDQDHRRLAAAWTLAVAAHGAAFLLVGAALVESARFAVSTGSPVAELELDAWVEATPASQTLLSPAAAPVVTEPTPPPEAVPRVADQTVSLPPPVAVASSPAPLVLSPPTPSPAVDAPPAPRPIEGAATSVRDQAATPAPVAQAVPVAAPAAAVVHARPDYERNPPPPYPRSARRQGLEGTVLLEVRVSPHGAVEALRVVRSSGHAVLDQAALRAVRDWHFRPARVGQWPIASTAEVPLRFTLEGAGPR